MRILGIDPGLDGGLALLTDDGLLLGGMPALGGKQREVDGGAVADLLNAWEPNYAFIEKVSRLSTDGCARWGCCDEWELCARAN